MTKPDHTYGPTYDTNERANTLDTGTHKGIAYAVTYGPGRGYLCGYVFIEWPMAGVWREYSHIALDILARPPFPIDMVKTMGEYVVVGFTGRIEGTPPCSAFMDESYQQWLDGLVGLKKLEPEDCINEADVVACCKHIIDKYLESCK